MKYWSRDKQFAEDHSLAIRFHTPPTGKRSKELGIPFSTSNLFIECTMCHGYHLIQEATCQKETKSS